MKITCVVDNTANFGSEFYSEHGLSFIIEYDDYKILFDTGRTPEVLKRNMELVNGFENLKYVVLSHGHEDHGGGLQYVIDHSSATVLINKNTLLPKYVSIDGSTRFVGTKVSETAERDCEVESRIELVEKIIEIAPDVFIFGEIRMENDFESISPSFLVEENGELIRDNFDDEQVLVFKTGKGLVILSGCAHRGIVNTVSSVSEYFGEDIYAVVGGTHLITANENMVNRTIEELVKFNPEYLMFGHCNGFDANCRFKKEFSDKFQIISSGKDTLEI